MARTTETYTAIMGSPLMTSELQQIYWVLWGYEWGLTKGETVAALKAQIQPANDKGWEKGMGTLLKMGLLKKGNKRHCTAKNKEDVVWMLTDRAEPIKPKAAKPSAKAYLKAIAQFEMVIAHHDSKGDGFITPELRKLYDWVRDKVDK